MPTYRYYRTTVRGRIVSGAWLEAEDLADAQKKVRALCAGEPYGCEIWLGSERLAVIPCEDPDPDPA